MERFSGTGVALVTPFTAENRIDYNALENLVELQIENNIDYLVVLGTTAETPALTQEEQKRITDKIIEVNRGRLPVVLGVGGNNTADVVQRAGNIDSEQIDAILTVVPYYNKPTQEGIYQHFKAVAQASRVPVILYNVPHRTGANMLPETVIRLAQDFENIIAIKEAAGNMAQAMEMISGKPDDFMVISGDDKLALPISLAGGSGVISVIGQALPEEFSEVIRLGLEGRSKEAYSMLYHILPSIDLIFEEGNPAGIKSMLEIQKICSREVRLPLIKTSEELHQKIRNFVANFKKEKYVIQES